MQRPVPNSFGVLHEVNHCHGDGQGHPCEGHRSRPGRVHKGDGYQIVFRSQGPRGNYFSRNDFVRDALTATEYSKLKTARVKLLFDGSHTGYLGAPIKWTAPNGVTVVYVRGQRRTERPGAAAVYHDFSTDDEVVIPLTRNIGSGRRALRAWAAAHVTNTITARFQARQLVRPGD